MSGRHKLKHSLKKNIYIYNDIGRERKMKNNQKFFNFWESKIIFKKFLITNYTLYYTYKMIIYSYALREFATPE